MTFGIHREPLLLTILHFKSLEHVLGIFGLRDESPSTQLLDLKTKEELQLSHHGHLEPIGQSFENSSLKALLDETNFKGIRCQL